MWLARNYAIFKDRSSIPEFVVAQSLNIFSHFPQGKDAPLVRFVEVESLDHSRSWDFVYGASKNDGQLHGGGVFLLLSNFHYFNIKMGLGPGTNNYTELMALKLLLNFVEGKGITTLQIFGDSMVVINWIRKSQKCHNIRLHPLLEVFIILATYRNISIRHVYRERNRATDKLSKEGSHGFWALENSRIKGQNSLRILPRAFYRYSGPQRPCPTLLIPLLI